MLRLILLWQRNAIDIPATLAERRARSYEAGKATPRTAARQSRDRGRRRPRKGRGAHTARRGRGIEERK
jgi:hypothetical protein